LDVKCTQLLNLKWYPLASSYRCIPISGSLLTSAPSALLGGAGAGLGSSLGSVPGRPPSAPSLNPPSQIDPSSIERAYAALGLTYQGNQIQGQTPQANMPSQAIQGQPGMRPLNPMGELGRLRSRGSFEESPCCDVYRSMKSGRVILVLCPTLLVQRLSCQRQSAFKRKCFLFLQKKANHWPSLL